MARARGVPGKSEGRCNFFWSELPFSAEVAIGSLSLVKRVAEYLLFPTSVGRAMLNSEQIVPVITQLVYLLSKGYLQPQWEYLWHIVFLWCWLALSARHRLRIFDELALFSETHYLDVGHTALRVQLGAILRVFQHSER